MVCAGCHERKHRAPRLPEQTPLALLRPPSKLKADVDGSKPFSYARLVQPVLDRHCVACHAKHPKTAMNLAREPIQRKWFASYVNLTKDYGFWRYGNGHRTTPGKFGARASKLLKILDAGHHDVKLSKEELHRITLWLDLSSVFYGVYEKERRPGPASRRSSSSDAGVNARLLQTQPVNRNPTRQRGISGHLDCLAYASGYDCSATRHPLSTHSEKPPTAAVRRFLLSMRSGLPTKLRPEQEYSKVKAGYR